MECLCEIACRPNPSVDQLDQNRRKPSSGYLRPPSWRFRLGRVGVVTHRTLIGGARYAVVGILVVAAFISPPDPISQIGLALPVYLLYEGAIWSVWWIERMRAKREAAAAAGTEVAKTE